MTANTIEPLKVVILLDRDLQPAWVVTAIREVLGCTFVIVRSVILWNQPILAQTPDPWVHKVYRWFDLKYYGRPLDPWQTTYVRSNLEDCAVTSILIPILDGQYVLDADLAAKLCLDQIDVALYFGDLRLTGAVVDAPRFGTWSLGPTSNLRNQALYAVLHAQHTITTTLWKLSQIASTDQPIYRSWTATHQFSVNRTNSALAWKAAHLMRRKLCDLHARGISALCQMDQDTSHNPATLTKEIQTATYARFWGRYLKEKVDDRLSFPHWIIAYRHDESPFRTMNDDRWVYLEPPATISWADPVVWEHDGQICIFVEEISDLGAKGHIAVFNLNEMNLDAPRPTAIIKQDYHMSYPLIFAWKDEIFMVPETKANQTIEVYRCKSYPYEWVLETRLFEDIQAVDTTLYEGSDYWWLFTHMPVENTSGNTNDDLYLYYAKSPFGPWRPHLQNPVVSDARSGRPAGPLFAYDGNLYRPAQDCTRRYGYAIALNRILKLTPQEYSEETVTKVYPTWSNALLATHTFNWYRGITVLDGYRRPSILRRAK